MRNDWVDVGLLDWESSDFEEIESVDSSLFEIYAAAENAAALVESELFESTSGTISESGAAVFGGAVSGADTYTPGGGGGISFSSLDDFNRASLGSNWSTPTLTGDGTILISSNQLAGNLSAPNSNDGWWNVSTQPVDTGAGVTVPTIGGGGFISCRITNPGTGSPSNYEADWDSSGNLSLWRGNGGSFTEIANAATVGVAISAGNKIGVIATGTGATVTIKIYTDTGSGWSEVFSYDDTSGSRLTSAGYVGVGFVGSVTRLDDFGTLAASSGTTYTEAGSIAGGWVTAAADAATLVDAGAVVGAWVASGQDVGQNTESGAAVFEWVASGAGFNGFTETGSVSGALVAGGADVARGVDGGGAVTGGALAAADALAGVDSGAVAFAGALAAADAFLGVDAGAAVLAWVVSGADTYTPGGGGTVYTESGAVVGAWVSSGQDVGVFADAGVAAGALVAGGVDVARGVDGGVGALALVASGQDVGRGIDAGAAVLAWVVSGDAFAVSPTGAPFVFVVRESSGAAAQSGAVARGSAAAAAQSIARARAGRNKAR